MSERVLIHDDGGECQGTLLDEHGACPACGLTPDMQSIALMHPHVVQTPSRQLDAEVAKALGYKGVEYDKRTDEAFMGEGLTVAVPHYSVDTVPSIALLDKFDEWMIQKFHDDESQPSELYGVELVRGSRVYTAEHSMLPQAICHAVLAANGQMRAWKAKQVKPEHDATTCGICRTG
jgi:hypothetical protein